MRKKSSILHLIKDIYVVIGLVLVWRGIWYVLDGFDKVVFGGSHFWTAVVGTLVGLIMLYLPEKNLQDIEKL
jgi:hypothetical protein